MSTAQYTPESRASASGTNTAAAWREVVQLLAQAAAMNAVYLEAADVEGLQGQFLKALETLKGDPNEASIKSAGRELADDLERYNKATQRAVTSSVVGLKETVSALTSGLRAFTEESGLTAQIETLQTIITNAKTPEELEVGRAQIGEVIEHLSQKERERTAKLGEFVGELQTKIDALESAAHHEAAAAGPVAQAMPAQMDTLTGIPNGAAAREAILHAQAGDPLPHLAVITEVFDSVERFIVRAGRPTA